MTSQLLKPTYDRSKVRPGIAHFGVGNFHRSHQAMYLDRLMNKGQNLDWGLVGIGVMPGDVRMRDALAAQDHLYTLVEVDGEASQTARQIGSILGMVQATQDLSETLELLASPAIRIVSLTITEGGYNINRVDGTFDLTNPSIAHDLANPSEPATVFGLITEGLRLRRDAGIPPFTVMSCDNLPGNGHVVRQAILTFAKAADPDLAEWIDTNVTFPNSMVDRITPVTTDLDREMIRSEYGVHDNRPVLCEPFVQWVLEDTFCNGRPAFEDVGVQIVEDVAPYELMKLRMLNGTHQAMAYIGILLGHTFVHEAIGDERINRFVREYLAEARPTLPPLPDINIDVYIESLLERFANQAIADTLARLAVDASDRIPKFVIPTIRDNLAAGRPITTGAAVIAHWARYLQTLPAIDDSLASEIVPLAKSNDPTAFIRYEPIFGDLAESDPFQQMYRTGFSLPNQADGAHMDLS